jgi:hypothetical protein
MSNGAVTLREEQRGQPYPFRERNLLLRNTLGKSFADVTGKAGAIFEKLEVSRGAAFGDIDNDGDVDILVTVNNGPTRLLRNDLPRRNWLTVQVEGPGVGLGARIALKATGLPELRRRIHTDSSYLSASDPRAHFGLSDASHIERVTIDWPDGTTNTYTDFRDKLNSVLRVTRQR